MPVALSTGTHQLARNSLPLDEHGYLLDRRLWNRALAQQLANGNGLGTLGTTHWMLIDFVRDKYFRIGALPPTRNLCRRMGLSRNAVRTAFGGCRQLWKVAGLPNPGDESLGDID